MALWSVLVWIFNLCPSLHRKCTRCWRRAGTPRARLSRGSSSTPPCSTSRPAPCSSEAQPKLSQIWTEPEFIYRPSQHLPAGLLCRRFVVNCKSRAEASVCVCVEETQTRTRTCLYIKGLFDVLTVWNLINTFTLFTVPALYLITLQCLCVSASTEFLFSFLLFTPEPQTVSS